MYLYCLDFFCNKVIRNYNKYVVEMMSPVCASHRFHQNVDLHRLVGWWFFAIIKNAYRVVITIIGQSMWSAAATPRQSWQVASGLSWKTMHLRGWTGHVTWIVVHLLNERNNFKNWKKAKYDDIFTICRLLLYNHWNIFVFDNFTDMAL